MSGHVARRTRMDDVMSGSIPGTGRSISCGRPTTMNSARSERFQRSVSVCRVKTKEQELKDEEQREMARAAFQEWLKRKCKEPRGPRASPSRDQISQHLKDDSKHRVFNTWLNNKKFEKKPANGTSNGSV